LPLLAYLADIILDNNFVVTTTTLVDLLRIHSRRDTD
jgi:hypothetical protein